MNVASSCKCECIFEITVLVGASLKSVLFGANLSTLINNHIKNNNVVIDSKKVQRLYQNACKGKGVDDWSFLLSMAPNSNEGRPNLNGGKKSAWSFIIAMVQWKPIRKNKWFRMFIYCTAKTVYGARPNIVASHWTDSSKAIHDWTGSIGSSV